MAPFLIKPVNSVKGKIFLLGDKSIAHRAIILSALSKCKTVINNFPLNQDCLSTVNAFKKLGLKIKYYSKKNQTATIEVFGKGLEGLKKSSSTIFIGESGTTFRILLGVLAGQNFKTTLTAQGSLFNRPMLRVTHPLRLMGAQIKARKVRNEEYSPITICGGDLAAICYKIPVSSAQVKSAILFAGLYAKGVTEVIEPLKTRDHTERMFKNFKAQITVKGNKVSIKGGEELVSPGKITVPGDISSATFFMVLAAISLKSNIILKNVTLNPTRKGAVQVLKMMGVNLKIIPNKGVIKGIEPTGDIWVRESKLKPVIVKEDEVPYLIDELPILMVAACFAKGKSIFKNVGELRFKETDRIRSMSENLAKMGADIRIVRDKEKENVIIYGKGFLKGAKVKSFADHRTAMSMIIAGLTAQGQTQLDETDCIKKSFPNFLDILKKIT